MQIPLAYAEEIIGIGGGNISFIRRTSGAVITLEESRTVPDQIVIEIKGNSTQVQTAQQLIEVVLWFPVFLNFGFTKTETCTCHCNISISILYHRQTCIVTGSYSWA